MAKVLLLGFAPLPVENPGMLSALNRRTWHIARALGEDGNDVLLLAVRSLGAYPDEASLPPVIERHIEPSILYRAVSDRAFHGGNAVQRWVAEFAPDAIVAASPRCGCRVAELSLQAPFWADLYGYLMGEAQAAAYVHDDDAHLAAWHRERAVLERADVFSTCSLRQRYAVIGELGAVGRLNKATAGYDFVRVLPSCIEPEPYEHTRDVLRGVLVEPDDFVVLFAGGYNTWTDVDTLFEGVTRAMRRNRRIKFVSTGGAIKGHDERTFAHFRQLIQASPFVERFLFTGWVPLSDVANYYLESDVGINVDKFNYDTLLGARDRLTHMCKAGLPALTSLGTEISFEIRRFRIGLTFPIGDATRLAEAILRLASERELRDDMGRRAARYALDNWSYAKVLEPLRRWVREPSHAPDFGQAIPTAVSDPAAVFAPRSRLAQLAWLIEREGYGRASRRTARALLRLGAGLARAAARAMARLAAKALFERREIAITEAAVGTPQQVLLIQAAPADQVAQAVARVRELLPGAEVTVFAREGEGAPAREQAGVRVIEARGAGSGIGAFYGQVRRLRSEEPDVAFVVGLDSRRAETLAWLTGGRVFLFGDRGRVYRNVIAPLRAFRRGAVRLLSWGEWLAYAALLGLVIIALGVADAAAALVRIARRGVAIQRRSQ